MTTILTKTSDTTEIPAASALVPRELAYSFASEKFFIKYPNGDIKEIGGYGPLEALTSSVAQKLSASDLKTINGQSLAGVGDIEIQAAGGGSTFALVPVTASTPEDTTLTGNLFTGDNAQTGASVTQYTVAGSSTVYLAGGTASISGVGSLTILATGDYTLAPTTNWSGLLPVVTYQAVNPGGEVRQSTLTMSVIAVNDPPTALSEYAIAGVGQSVTFQLLANDLDLEGSVSLVSVNGQAPVIGQTVTIPNGSFVVTSGDTLTITGGATYTGEISIPYVITDGTLTTPSTATVDFGVAEMAMVSPISPAEPWQLNWFMTAMEEYGPAGGPNNPTTVDNGIACTSETYTTNQGKFVNTRADWLFDYATLCYRIWKASGIQRYHDAWIARTQQYFDNVVLQPDGVAYFNVEAPAEVLLDWKYSYCTVGWIYETETGDTQYRAKSVGLAKHQLTQFRVFANIAPDKKWTERDRAFAIRETLAAYHLTADPYWLTECNDFVNDTYTMMAAGGGAPQHGEYMHEAAGSLTTKIVSPWMTAQLVEALLQHYRTTADARFLPAMSALCDWLTAANALYIPASPEIPGLLPYYYVRDTGSNQRDKSSGEEGDANHSYDVLSLFKLFRWAKQQLGHSLTSVNASIDGLQLSANWHFGNMTRFGGPSDVYPKYRISPKRKAAWWFNFLGNGSSFALQVPLPAPIPAPTNSTPPSLGGVAQQGDVMVGSSGTWSPSTGANVPTYSFSIQRSTDSGVTWATVAGSTGTAPYSYTPVLADVGAGRSIRLVVTATNAKSATVAYSQAYTIAAAGAPSITGDLQSVASVQATGTITLTVATTGAGLTFRWEKSTDSGVTWTTAQESASNQLILSAVPRTDNGSRYRVYVSNATGSATSSVLALTVTPPVRRVGLTPAGADNGSGCVAYYASASALEAAERRNLVTQDLILQIEADAFNDTTPVTFSSTNWGSDIDHYIRWIVRVGHRHSGVIGAGYRLSTATQSGYILTIDSPYMQVNDVAIYSNDTSTAARRGIYISKTCTVNNPLVVGVQGTFGIGCTNNTGDLNNNPIINNPIVIGYQYGIQSTGSSSRGFMTVVGGTCVMQTTVSYYCPGGSAMKTINCYGHAVGVASPKAFDMSLVNANSGILNCASSDTTGSAGLTNVQYSTATFTSITAGAENLGLAVGSALAGAGTATGATATNIAGEARTNPPNIGAF